MMSIIKAWKTYKPQQPRRSKNMKSDAWSPLRQYVSQLHHNGKTKPEILCLLHQDPWYGREGWRPNMNQLVRQMRLWHLRADTRNSAVTDVDPSYASPDDEAQSNHRSDTTAHALIPDDVFRDDLLHPVTDDQENTDHIVTLQDIFPQPSSLGQGPGIVPTAPTTYPASADLSSQITLTTTPEPEDLVHERWDIFSRPRVMNVTMLEQPEVERLWKILGEEKSLIDADIISAFMRHRDHHSISAEADVVEDFCGSISLRSIETEKQHNAQPVALVFDTEVMNGNVRNKSKQGPLTVAQLYGALRKPRFESKELTSLAKTENSMMQLFPPRLKAWLPQYWHTVLRPATASTTYGKPEDDLAVVPPQQRRTFVSDLAPGSIAAILGAASPDQANALSSTIYRHLRFQPSVTIEIPISKGFKIFHLSFHLPYRAMRNTNTPKLDKRTFADGRRLRGCEDVSFLKARSSTTSSYLYQAQVSFSIVGVTEQTWVSYCFDDTYFEADQDDQGLAEFYHASDPDIDQSCEVVDPSARGRCLDFAAAQDAREYFLKILEYTIGDTMKEWQRVIDQVGICISECEQMKSEVDRASSPDTRGLGRRTETLNAITRISKVCTLAKKLSRELLDEVRTIKEFLNQNSKLFSTDWCRRLLSATEQMLIQMDYQCNSLNFAVENCDNLSQEFELRLYHTSTSADGKNSTTLRFIYPVAIAAGLFSVDENVLPFRRNAKVFLLLVLVFALVIHLGSNSHRYWQYVVVFLNRNRSHEYLEATAQQLLQFPRRYLGEAGEPEFDPESSEVVLGHTWSRLLASIKRQTYPEKKAEAPKRSERSIEDCPVGEIGATSTDLLQGAEECESGNNSIRGYRLLCR